MASNRGCHQIPLSNEEPKPLLALRIQVHCDEYTNGSSQCHPSVHIKDVKRLRPVIQGIFELDKDQVELAVEESGSKQVIEEFTDLTFLRFSDVDPLILPQGNDSSPVPICEKLCEIRHFYDKKIVDAINKRETRLVLWIRAQRRLLDSQIDKWIDKWIGIWNEQNIPCYRPN